MASSVFSSTPVATTSTFSEEAPTESWKVHARFLLQLDGNAGLLDPGDQLLVGEHDADLAIPFADQRRRRLGRGEEGELLEILEAGIAQLARGRHVGRHRQALGAGDHQQVQPAAAMRKRQASYAGPAAGLAAWLKGYATAGASHLVLRFAGDHEKHLDIVAGLRGELD